MLISSLSVALSSVFPLVGEASRWGYIYIYINFKGNVAI